MPNLIRWRKQHENDVRRLLPAVMAQEAARATFSEEYGKRHARRMLAEASDAHTANVRRTRAVLVGIATVRERLASDPAYTAQRAASDMATLRGEYDRLKADLPRLAIKLEDARAADADPITFAENQFERFPALADRLPGLPVLRDGNPA
jgi:hypothetical protein